MKFKGAWTKTTGRRPLIIFREGKKSKKNNYAKKALKQKLLMSEEVQ